MIFGAITNSWRTQLADQSLAELIAAAESRGSRHIELRQTCLGDCESGQGVDWRPNLPGLQAIADSFPALTFDLAMAFPCLTFPADPAGAQFQAALAGAKIVGRAAPHLRIVDPISFDAPWETAADLPPAALGVADLAQEAAGQGVILSMENSGQPIGSMALLVRECRARMNSAAAPYLGLCPDPVNQLRRFPQRDALAELDALPLDVLKIVHFKQAREGNPYPAVADGDLDCHQMLRLLETKGYAGPAIMEIPPHPEVLANLTDSYRYLRPADY